MTERPDCMSHWRWQSHKIYSIWKNCKILIFCSTPLTSMANRQIGKNISKAPLHARRAYIDKTEWTTFGVHNKSYHKRYFVSHMWQQMVRLLCVHCYWFGSKEPNKGKTICSYTNRKSPKRNLKPLKFSRTVNVNKYAKCCVLYFHAYEVIMCCQIARW